MLWAESGAEFGSTGREQDSESERGGGVVRGRVHSPPRPRQPRPRPDRK